MSLDNVLKKEFKTADVNRLRNLVTKKYGDKTLQGVGYSKEKEFHQEGDVWEEEGREWTIKKGLKQNVTKLDSAKDGIVLPLFCPCCSSLMKPHLDKQFYIQFNRCFNCQVDFESDLRRQGLFEEYEKFVNNNHIEGIIGDYENFIDNMINSPEKFMTERGDEENWSGNNKKKLLQNKEETIKFLTSLKK